MRYSGGKAQTAPLFAHVLRSALVKAKGRLYEPFTGAYNIVPTIFGDIKSAHCSDTHPGIIKLWRAVQAKWLPPRTLSRSTYEFLHSMEDWSNPITAFAAFGCSYSGKEWGGYLAGSKTPNEISYVEQSWNLVYHKSRFMDPRKVTFALHSYDEGPGATNQIMTDHLIYCDPPARRSNAFGVPEFDYGEFWKWARRQAMHNDVYVSDTVVPSGSDKWLEVVWTKDTKRTRTRSEYLLRVKG